MAEEEDTKPQDNRPPLESNGIPPLQDLRLSQDFANITERVITTVPVGKPDRQTFIRVRPGDAWRLPIAILHLKEQGDTFLVAPHIALEIPNEVQPVVVVVVVDRQDQIRLWPLKLPRDGRASPWHTSALAAAKEAENAWIRVVANIGAGSYDVIRARGDFSEPTWPDLTLTFQKLIEIAFEDRYISTIDHPALRRLRGDE